MRVRRVMEWVIAAIAIVCILFLLNLILGLFRAMWPLLVVLLVLFGIATVLKLIGGRRIRF